jgi:hypothetical protein
LLVPENERDELVALTPVAFGSGVGRTRIVLLAAE